jgi:hypothetical protein
VAPLREEKASPAPVSCPRDEVVARETTPRGEIFLDGRFRRENLQELAGNEPIEPGAKVQQESVPAVHVAAVEAVVRCFAMALDGTRRDVVFAQ